MVSLMQSFPLSYWKSIKLAAALVILRLKPYCLNGEQYTIYLQIGFVKNVNFSGGLQKNHLNEYDLNIATKFVLSEPNRLEKHVKKAEISSVCKQKKPSSVAHETGIKLLKQMLQCAALKSYLPSKRHSTNPHLSDEQIIKFATNATESLHKVILQMNDSMLILHQKLILTATVCIVDAMKLFEEDLQESFDKTLHSNGLTEFQKSCLGLTKCLINMLQCSTCIQAKVLCCKVFCYYAQCGNLCAANINQLLSWIVAGTRNLISIIKFQSFENLSNTVAMTLINLGMGFKLLKIVTSISYKFLKTDAVNVGSSNCICKPFDVSACLDEVFQKSQMTSTTVCAETKIMDKPRNRASGMFFNVNDTVIPDFTTHLVKESVYECVLSVAHYLPIVPAYGLNFVP